MVLFRVNCTIPTLSKSKAVRGKYCILLPGEGNEFQLSTKDTLISRRVMCLVGSFVVNNILKRLHHVEIVKEAMEYKLERLNTTLIRSIYNTPIYKQVDVLPGNPTYDKFTSD